MYVCVHVYTISMCINIHTEKFFCAYVWKKV